MAPLAHACTARASPAWRSAAHGSVISPASCVHLASSHACPGLCTFQVESFGTQKYPYVFEDDGVGHGAVLRYGKNSTFRPEEMVAFVLSYAKQVRTGSTSSDALSCQISSRHWFVSAFRTSDCRGPRRDFDQGLRHYGAALLWSSAAPRDDECCLECAQPCLIATLHAHHVLHRVLEAHICITSRLVSCRAERSLAAA